MDMGGIPIRDASTVGIRPAPAADATVSGTIIELTAGASLVFGDIGYIAATGKVLLADADALATSGAVVLCTEALSDTQAGDFLLHGIARLDTWNWTVGGIIYLSTTAGGMTQTAPSATDDVIQILGVATHADRIFFNPSLVQVEHT